MENKSNKDYQAIFANASGVTKTMFNPYDLNSIYSSYKDFTGILSTKYFLNYYPFLADIYNAGHHIKNSINNHEKNPKS